MAYRSCVEGKETLDVTNFIKRDGSSYVCQVQIGDDDETGHIYSILVSLAPAIASPPQHMELVFFVVRTNPETGEVEDLSDGRQTKPFLDNKNLRNGILGLICSVSCELLNVAKPEVVNYMTVDTNLPKKALKKYTTLCNALQTVGYTGKEVDVYLGNHMWVLQRSLA